MQYSFSIFHSLIYLIIILSTLNLTACSTIKKISRGHDAPLIEKNEHESSSQHESTARKLMITSQCPYATQAARDIYKRGGNIFDAMVTASFTLSVTRPQSTGLGGGGFALIKTSEMKEPLGLDFREKAPQWAFRKMFTNEKGEILKDKSKEGIWATAVPGLVAGLIEIHDRYGKLPLAELLQSSIELAKHGFPINSELAMAINSKKDLLSRYEATRSIFFKNGEPLKEGETLIQEDLAKTLELLSKEGKKAIYDYYGSIAQKIIKEEEKLGGLMTLEDLSEYAPVYRKAVHGTFRNYDIFSMPPPSSGGIHILEILNIIENDPIDRFGPSDPRSIHLISSAMQMAFADRAKYLGDPDFISIPIKGLLSKDYAKSLRNDIDMNKIKKQNELGNMINPNRFESNETTHLSLMDQEGNVISSTQTINGHFGSGIVVSGTGIVLNNQMDDFAADVGSSNLFGAVGGPNNLVDAHKRPLSSMSPTIVYKDNKPFMTLGSPGGTRIISCLALTLINYLAFGMTLRDSVMALRYHHQWYPDKLLIEGELWKESLIEDLKKKSYELSFDPSEVKCRVQAIANEKDFLRGFSDERGAGMALGL